MYAASYIWAKILSYLEQQLSEITVSAWFDDAEVVSLSETELIVYSPSSFRQARIRTNCAPYIEAALQALFQLNAKLIVWGEAEMKLSKDKQLATITNCFNPHFVFENFIAGSTNAVPLKIASAVAAAPGTEIYNPVFFYGPSGVGKTHLLYAIANELAKQHAEKKIVFVKGEQFTTDLVKAILNGGTAHFREKYREADILLVDDIQFIAGKESTQEEFFHTFNELYEHGKQIVMTADRKPADMATLEDRLRNRFGVGVMVSINPADFETRVLITKAKAKQMNLVLSAEVIQYIAAVFPENIRQIEGALKKIRAFQDLASMELSLDNVSQTIEDMRTTENSLLITPALIVRNVCKYYGVDEETLKSPQRCRNVSEPRQIAMYLMRQMLNMSHDEIAKYFSRERTTVIHALKQVEKLSQTKGSKLESILHELQSNITACL